MKEVIILFIVLAIMVCLYSHITNVSNKKKNNENYRKVEYLESVGFILKDFGDHKCLIRNQQMIPLAGISCYTLLELQSKFY